MGTPRTTAQIGFREAYFPLIVEIIEGKLDKDGTGEFLVGGGSSFYVDRSQEGFIELSEEAAYGESDLMDELVEAKIPFDAYCGDDCDIEATSWYGRLNSEGVFELLAFTEDSQTIDLEEAVNLSKTEEGRKKMEEMLSEVTFVGDRLLEIPVGDEHKEAIDRLETNNSLSAAAL